MDVFEAFHVLILDKQLLYLFLLEVDHLLLFLQLLDHLGCLLTVLLLVLLQLGNLSLRLFNQIL